MNATNARAASHSGTANKSVETVGFHAVPMSRTKFVTASNDEFVKFAEAKQVTDLSQWTEASDYASEKAPGTRTPGLPANTRAAGWRSRTSGSAS